MLQHRLTDFFPVSRAFELLPLVVQVPTFCQTDANFDAAFREVHVQRNQSEALLLGTFGKLVKLPFMNEELASSFRLVIHQVGLRVLVNVCPNEPQLSIANAPVRFFDRNLRVANTLNLAAEQRDAALQLVNDVVLVPCFAVRADVLRVWIIVLLFLLLTFLAGHLCEFWSESGRSCHQQRKCKPMSHRQLNRFTQAGEYMQFGD